MPPEPVNPVSRERGLNGLKLSPMSKTETSHLNYVQHVDASSDSRDRRGPLEALGLNGGLACHETLSSPVGSRRLCHLGV